MELALRLGYLRTPHVPPPQLDLVLSATPSVIVTWLLTGCLRLVLRYFDSCLLSTCLCSCPLESRDALTSIGSLVILWGFSPPHTDHDPTPSTVPPISVLPSFPQQKKNTVITGRGCNYVYTLNCVTLTLSGHFYLSRGPRFSLAWRVNSSSLRLSLGSHLP